MANPRKNRDFGPSKSLVRGPVAMDEKNIYDYDALIGSFVRGS